ncbi:hypothetical protein H5410_003448 [Solanum commersonii]|uniref:Uncharacterized protein n=1 Tax=Solanum commersonii TaxID=4109 RepID=A0A9J6B543_SOLCO|nr:hypothetical protein H5410_003448 [Solanum commersonii]
MCGGLNSTMLAGNHVELTKTRMDVSTSSHRKRVRSGNVPPTPSVPIGQTGQFGGEGCNQRTESMSWKSATCTWSENSMPTGHPEGRSHFVTVRGVNVPITPADINDILELNIRTVLKSAMRKAWIHKGHKYAFGGLITKMCRPAGDPEENVDYMSPLFPTPVISLEPRGSTLSLGQLSPLLERHRRNELIMARMYGLEMLCHQNGCLASTDMQLGEVESCYPLNDHDMALLGIGPEFREPVDNDIPIDEERLRTSLDMESNSDEEVDPAQAGDEAE